MEWIDDREQQPQCEVCSKSYGAESFPFDECRYCGACPSRHHGRCCQSDVTDAAASDEAKTQAKKKHKTKHIESAAKDEAKTNDQADSEECSGEAASKAKEKNKTKAADQEEPDDNCDEAAPKVKAKNKAQAAAQAESAAHDFGPHVLRVACMAIPLSPALAPLPAGDGDGGMEWQEGQIVAKAESDDSSQDEVVKFVAWSSMKAKAKAAAKAESDDSSNEAASQAESDDSRHEVARLFEQLNPQMYQHFRSRLSQYSLARLARTQARSSDA